MDTKTITGKIRQMKLRDVAYSIIMISGFLIFATMFGLSIKFLFDSINDVFQLKEEEYQITRFDLDGFKRVADRIGIKL